MWLQLEDATASKLSALARLPQSVSSHEEVMDIFRGGRLNNVAAHFSAATSPNVSGVPLAIRKETVFAPQFLDIARKFEKKVSSLKCLSQLVSQRHFQALVLAAMLAGHRHLHNSA